MINSGKSRIPLRQKSLPVIYKSAVVGRRESDGHFKIAAQNYTNQQVSLSVPLAKSPVVIIKFHGLKSDAQFKNTLLETINITGLVYYTLYLIQNPPIVISMSACVGRGVD